MVKERKPPTRRTRVKDMPQPKKELTAAEQRRVKGGALGSPCETATGTTLTEPATTPLVPGSGPAGTGPR